jgi:Na+:H+ antiporter, NhaA family
VSRVRTLPKTVIRPLQTFLQAETSGGILLVVFAVVALIWVNVAPEAYTQLWETELSLALGSQELSMTLREWVNDGLMTIFFFVVGLEIKREVVQGELRNPKNAALPVIGAIGGMVVPAGLFLLVNIGSGTADGWGVPMATDIAMAIGVLALAGRGVVPPALTIFLLALAIVDDLGAIIVIAIAYSDGLEMVWLLVALAGMGTTILVRVSGVRPIPAYVALGVFVWFALHHAGVHATLAGVVMGLIAPTTPLVTPSKVQEAELVDLSDPEALRSTITRARHSVSVVERLEHALVPWTTFVILPLFALANAGIRIDAELLDGIGSSTVVLGIILGLVIGKPLGITLAAWLAVKAGVAQLPQGVRWAQIVSVSMVAGIGFTVAIFVADLAFEDPLLLGQAKLAILLASVVAAVIGLTAVRSIGRRQIPLAPAPTAEPAQPV